MGRKFARFYTIFFKGKFCQYFFNWHSVVLITWNWPWKFHFNLKSYLSAQWAKGYCFDQKISKYFFLLHCDKKFQKWFFYPSLHFSRGEFFFSISSFSFIGTQKHSKKKNATIPGASFWFSVYLSTYKGKSEN